MPDFFFLDFSMAGLWGEIPPWLKAIGWLAGVSLIVFPAVALGGWSIPLGMAVAYGFHNAFFTWDEVAYKMEEYERSGDPHDGLDVIETAMNGVNPVTPIAQDLFGIKFPGAGGADDGLADDAIRGVGNGSQRVDDADIDWTGTN